MAARIDEESPSPTCSPVHALQVGGQRALQSTRQHGTGWLGDVVKAHPERDFVWKIPLARIRTSERSGKRHYL